MVLLALGVVSVSLCFWLYKYRWHSARSELPRQDEKREHATSNSTSDKRQGKAPPSFEVTLPDVKKPEDGQVRVTASEMKNPFEDEDAQAKPIHNMPPPSLTTTANNKMNFTDGLMPPPSRAIPQSKSKQSSPSPSNPSTLRPPPSTASTLRAPPGRASQTSSLLAPSTSTLAPSSRSTRKVLLEPGHSPLDWAHLISNPPSPTFLRGADVPPSLIRVPPSLLKYHNGRKDKVTGQLKDAWGTWQGKVYNLSPYLKFHPGGPDQLMRGAGNTKAEQLFNETHSWVSWDNMMGECLVGILVSENDAQSAGTMDEMD